MLRTPSAVFSVYWPDEWRQVVFIILQNVLTLPNCAPRQRLPRVLPRSSDGGRVGLGQGTEELRAAWTRGMIDSCGVMNPGPAWRSNCQECNIRPTEVLTSAVIRLYPRTIWAKINLEWENLINQNQLFFDSLFMEEHFQTDGAFSISSNELVKQDISDF